jgi:hypothetical protein
LQGWPVEEKQPVLAHLWVLLEVWWEARCWEQAGGNPGRIDADVHIV